LYTQYRAGIPQKTAFHSPTNFVEPDAFIPERWLNEDPKFNADNKEIFEPFMVGPRNCIGKPYVHPIPLHRFYFSYFSSGQKIHTNAW